MCTNLDVEVMAGGTAYVTCNDCGNVFCVCPGAWTMERIKSHECKAPAVTMDDAQSLADYLNEEDRGEEVQAKEDHPR